MKLWIKLGDSTEKAGVCVLGQGQLTILPPQQFYIQVCLFFKLCFCMFVFQDSSALTLKVMQRSLTIFIIREI